MRARLLTPIFLLLMCSTACSEDSNLPISITLEKDEAAKEVNVSALSVKNELDSGETPIEQAKVQTPISTERSPEPELSSDESPTVIASGSASPLQNEDNMVDAGSTMLVLDMSGSMWGQINGRSKIEIEREVVSSAISNWDTSAKLGLMAYGHRREGDCDDIEVLVEPVELDAQKFSSTVNALQPKGKTPMSAAVQKAALALRSSEEKATVILISDGKETCSLDPCQVGKDLEASGADFTAHVIGFDLKEEDTVGLRCLAETTGGVYISAENAETLTDALDETRELATAPVSKLNLDPATVDAPDEVAAGANFAVNWTGPKNQYDRLIILSLDGKRRFGSGRISKKSVEKYPAVKLVAPEMVGQYIVEYRTQHGQTLGEDTFEVVATSATVATPAQIIAGSKFDVEWTGPQNQDDEIIFLSVDGKRQPRVINTHAKTSPTSYRAPLEVGVYEAQYKTRQGTILTKASFEVIKPSIMVDVPDKVVAGSKFEVRWVGPRNENDRLRIAGSTDNKTFRSTSIAQRSKTKSPALLTAPEEPGRYKVEYFVQYEKKVLMADEFEVIAATASVSAPSTIPAKEKFIVQWTGPRNQLDDIRLIGAKDKKLRARQAVGASINRIQGQESFELRAPAEPGQYILQYRTKSKRVLASQIITVR